jgi:hypothetical protein
LGDGTVLDAAHKAQRETRAELRRLDRHLDRAFAITGDRLDLTTLERAEAGRREIAGDAMDAGGVGTVRRQVDLDDRVVEMRVGREGRADRRISRQVDDAIMLIRQLKLALGAHHAVAFNAADLADRQRHVDAGHIGAGSGEGADQPGPCIGRAADDLDGLAVTGVDGENLQLVGVGMPVCRQHLGNDERLEGRLVVDGLNFEADRRQALDDLVERSVGVEMILEPGEGEFHGFTRFVSLRSSTSTTRNRSQTKIMSGEKPPLRAK